MPALRQEKQGKEIFKQAHRQFQYP